MLSFPDFSKPLLLDTDASDTGIGAVLSQVVDGKERVISYASRTLSRAERRYCVTRRELLAIVTFVQQFRPYLLGRQFQIRTDHGSLTWLQNFKDPVGQMARWMEKLQDFDFVIVHRRGSKHGNADALSRLPCQQCGRESHDPEAEDSLPPAVNTVLLQQDQTHDIRQLQEADPSIGLVLRAKQQDCQLDLTGCTHTTRRLSEIRSQLEIHEGILFRRYQPRNNVNHLQLVVPACLRSQVLKELHEGPVNGGHLGSQKLLSALKDRFYWPGHASDVKDWCNTCYICATRKSPIPAKRAPLQPITCDYPLEKVAADIVGPFPVSKTGNKYILVVMDYFTRWAEAYAIPNQEATTVASKLVDEFFCRFSVPSQLHSDQGRQFESSLIKEICKLLDIKKSRTTPYHPEGDGLVERYNKTLLHMLSTTSAHDKDWEQHIRQVCMAYNSTTQATTGYSPFFLMFGRKPQLPIDLSCGTASKERKYVNEYVTDLQSSFRRAYQEVRKSVSDAQEHQKQRYDQQNSSVCYEVGDLVWLHSSVVPQAQSKKLHRPWKGPFVILKCMSSRTYCIQSLATRKQSVVHFNRLKPCISGTRFGITPSGVSASPRTVPTPAPPGRVENHHSKEIGKDLQLCDNDEPLPPAPRRYPTRQRAPPQRYSPSST